MSRLVICGSGTEVGKTYVACSILRGWAGERRGLKPVESGVSGVAADAAALAEAAGHALVRPLHALRDPVSPHLAARRQGVRIGLSEIATWVREQEGGLPCVVETAGGLLSPLNEEERNVDLLVRLEPRRVVLVAANRLGVLHDVEGCLRALDAVGMRDRTHVVVSGWAADASCESNVGELERLSRGVPVHACGAGAEAPPGLLELVS
jgi:dethiobiotin synthetase